MGGEPLDAETLVFRTVEGVPLRSESSGVQAAFRRVLRRAGLPQTFTIYSLRHSCATTLLVAGEHPKVVSERLGHSGVQITMDRYSHVVAGLEERAAARLDGALFGG